MLKLIHTDEIPKVAGLKYFGDFNDLPQPWKEITKDKFRQLFGHHQANYQEYRQICNDENFQHFFDLHIFWYADFGLAIHFPANWSIKNNEIAYNWPETKYLYFGCEHDFDRTTIGNCLHLCRCKICGYTEQVDSSG